MVTRYVALAHEGGPIHNNFDGVGRKAMPFQEIAQFQGTQEIDHYFSLLVEY